MEEKLGRYAANAATSLTAWRRHLHTHPELSFAEFETTSWIAQRLQEWGVAFERPAPTGLVGLIVGERPGPTVAIRADIDALPIHEQNTFDFRSMRDGVMHACGHDGHTAIVLGLARFFSANRDFPGRLKFLFQAAEEKPPGGAQQLIAAGALDDVDACIGLHLFSDFALGKVGITPGPVTANADNFVARIAGRGGHGAQPHQTIDAVMVACHAVVNLQTIVSRKIDPRQPAVISVGRIQGGGAANVIAETAEIAGTVRSYDDGVRQVLHGEIRRTLEATCAIYGASVEVEYTWGYPALENHPAVAEVLREAAAKTLGADAPFRMEPLMGGEDFAYYTRKAPSAFLFLGSATAEADSAWPHHHPRFTVDERALPQGVEILGRAALRLLREGV